MDNIYRRFRENIINAGMINSGDRILLSMSAGKDSVAMFHLIEKLKEEISFETAVFHLNHLTRGIESDRDEEFIRKLTQVRKIPLHSMKYNFSENFRRGISFEEQARNIRYEMINEICFKEGYNKTATAHNYDDRAETVLMRIFSGTGIRGLRSIESVTESLIRPMLLFSAPEIYRYLEDHGFGWREDKSNEDLQYLRNFVRKKLFPVITERFKDAVKNINRLADHAAENERLLSDMVADNYGNCWSVKERSFIIYMDRLPQDESLIKFILSRLLYSIFGLKLSYPVIEEILRNYKSSKSNINVYYNPEIGIDKKMMNNEIILHVYETKCKINPLNEWEYTVNINISDNVYIEEIKRILYFERVDNKDFSKNMIKENKIYISLPAECSILTIRSRRKGDKIILENGCKKIKDLLIEKKLDTVSKSIVPILEINRSIAAFLPGFAGLEGNRISSGFKVNNISDKIIAIYSSVKS